MLHFRFDEEATVQAAGYLLQKYEGQRHCLYSLVKMIYFADRAMLIRYGQSITGSKLVAMEHGPVPSDVYDEAKGQGPTDLWMRHISRVDRRSLLLRAPAGTDHLSKAAIAILDAVYQEYGHLDFKEIKRRAHALPEHRETRSSHTIDPASILRFAGASEDRIRTIQDDVMEFNEAMAALA